MKNSEIDYSRYIEAVENVLCKIPVKNRKVSLLTIQLETSLPRDLLLEIIKREKIELPERVDEIIYD